MFTFFLVAAAPNLLSLKQILTNIVKVEWSQPSGGATVTSYVVHYSDGITDRNDSVIVSQPRHFITNLTNGLTYTISVEATSQEFSGESENMTIILSEHNVLLLH